MTHFMKTKVKKTVLYGLAFMASKWTIIFLLYHSGFWTYWFLLLFPIADTVAAITAVIYLKGNFKKYFAEELEREYPNTFKLIIEEVNEAFESIEDKSNLKEKSKNPLDKRLRFSAYFLAFIQVMEKRNLSFDEIKKHCLSIAKEYVKPKNRIHKWYLKLVPKLLALPFYKRFLKNLDDKVGIKHREGGFRAKIITDKNETLGFGYGIDILECGICHLFQQNQASKYQNILCEVDHLTSELAGLQLIRTSTIAEGASKCDFRFQKLATQ
jgi:hypothetical protein